MLFLFTVRVSNEKIRQSAPFPALQSSEELTADLLTKPRTVPAFIQYGLEIGELNTCRPLKPLESKRFKTLNPFYKFKIKIKRSKTYSEAFPYSPPPWYHTEKKVSDFPVFRWDVTNQIPLPGIILQPGWGRENRLPFNSALSS
jgi:hypothetical protein